MGVNFYVFSSLLGLGNFYNEGRNMTKEEVIRMAQEAGWDDHHAQFDTRFQTFAALVASAEREEIAQFIEQTELGSLPDETALQYARLLKSYSSSIRARGQA